MDHTDTQNDEHLIRLVRVARGLEAEGFLNAAKLLWALLFSEQIRASNRAHIPRAAAGALDQELATVIEKAKTNGATAELIAALETGRKGAQENRTITHDEVPDLQVCRRCGEIMIGDEPERCPGCAMHRLTYHRVPITNFFDRLTPGEVLAALEKGPERLENAAQGLTAEQMNQVPSPGEWSARELFLHLLMAQELLAGRVEKILTEDDPPITAAAAWILETEASLSAGEIFEQYRDSRQKLLERLQAISAQDWERAGWHDEFARVTVRDQATYFARHEHTHLVQLDEIRDVVMGNPG